METLGPFGEEAPLNLLKHLGGRQIETSRERREEILRACYQQFQHYLIPTRLTLSNLAYSS